MDGMARPCGVDIPDAAGSQHAHVGILQNAGRSVKPRNTIHAVGANSESRRFIESCQSRFSRLSRVSRYSAALR